MKKIEDKYATWVFLAPVAGVGLAKGLEHPFRIVGCQLVRSESIPLIRKRLGFKLRISELLQRHGKLLRPFFENKRTFITLRVTGKGVEARKRFMSTARDELHILALSQLGWGRRPSNAYPCVSSERPHGSVTFLMFNAEDYSWARPNYLVGKYMNLFLDRNWLRFHREFFFLELLRILRKETRVSKHWRQTLYNASVLAGMSQCSSELPSAFLWNMIAIEILLTRQGDRCVDVLPERAEAFLGWATDWRRRNFEEKIRALYSKRCMLVHDGRRDGIGVDDILFSDELLFNLLGNLVRHHKLFDSKDSVVEFSEKMKAEKLLGIRSSVRPKTLHFTKRHYSEKDFEAI